MRNLLKHFGIIALVAVIGLGFVACSKKAGAQEGGKAIVSEGEARHIALGAPGKHYVLDKETDFIYDLVKIDGQDYVSIRGYNNPSGFISPENIQGTWHLIDSLTMIIPETIEGYPVGRIVALYGGMTLLAVSIPDTVREIGFMHTGVYPNQTEPGRGFRGANITSIKLPRDLKILGVEAFARCINLTGSITIPEGVEDIADSAFVNTAITEVIMSDNVKTIGRDAFSNCRELVNVQLPSSPITYTSLSAQRRHDIDRGIDNVLGRRILKRLSDYYISNGQDTAQVLVEDPSNNAFLGCSKLSLATRSAIEASGYTGRF